MQRKLNIAVMLGGPSAEREVSLRSGAAVAQALRTRGHTVYEVDPAPGAWRLPPGIDLVFLALHGSYGEDGSVQEELERAGVPYTGCGPESSRIAFDKVLTKQRCLERGVPTARHVVLHTPSAALPTEISLPVVIKPVRQGSSVGLEFVDEPGQWQAALANSLRYDSEVIVEERVIGREVTVGILEDQALPIVEVRPKRGAYDYGNKYTSGATEYFCPAEFDPETTERIQKASLVAFEAVGGRDYGRVDVMVTRDGRPVVLEVNTLPGMTETSLLPKAAAAAGMDYETLCERMVALAWGRATARA